MKPRGECLFGKSIFYRSGRTEGCRSAVRLDMTIEDLIYCYEKTWLVSNLYINDRFLKKSSMPTNTPVLRIFCTVVNEKKKKKVQVQL